MVVDGECVGRRRWRRSGDLRRQWGGQGDEADYDESNGGRGASGGGRRRSVARSRRRWRSGAGGGGAPVSFGLARAHEEVRMSEGSAEVVSGGGEGVGVARWGGNGAAGALGSGEQLRRRRGFSVVELGRNWSRERSIYRG